MFWDLYVRQRERDRAYITELEREAEYRKIATLCKRAFIILFVMLVLAFLFSPVRKRGITL
jgi:hypothetical protein